MLDFEKISPKMEQPEKKPKRKFDRRTFLKKTAIITGALLIGNETIEKNPLRMTTLIKKLQTFYKNSKKENFPREESKKPKENAQKDDKFQQNAEKPNDSSKNEQKRTEKKETLSEMEMLAENVLLSYHEIYQKEGFIPPEVFTKNFLIATQLKESKYKPDAESKFGAVGVMQIMPETIKDIIRYLHILNRKINLDFDGPKSEELSDDDIEELKVIIKNNGNYGRAFGKIYFAMLFKHYNVGVSDFKKGDIESAQIKLLSVYNGGLRVRGKSKKYWRTETRKYCQKIVKYMKYLDIFQEKIKENDIKSNGDYLSMLLVKKMSTYHKINLDDDLFYELMDKYIANIKLAENARHRKLSDRELLRILNKLQSKLLRYYLTKLKKKK